MHTQQEFGIVYNPDYEAWYIVFTTDLNIYKIDSKFKITKNQYDIDCIQDSFIERITEIAKIGYIFNPYITAKQINEEEWF